MIVLPDWAVPNGGEPRLIDNGGVVRPALGGEIQRISRLGNRFGISLSFPPMRSHERGRILLNRLLLAKTQGVRVELPLLGFKPGSPGTPVVDGAGQAGSTLNVRGFTPNYAVKEGQFFSVERADGRHYLHHATAQVIADASGDAAVPVNPMLRYEFADGATCHFGKPMIEGLVEGEDYSWQMSLDHLLSLSVSIEERA